MLSAEQSYVSQQCFCVVGNSVHWVDISRLIAPFPCSLLNAMHMLQITKAKITWLYVSSLK